MPPVSTSTMASRRPSPVRSENSISGATKPPPLLSRDFTAFVVLASPSSVLRKSVWDFVAAADDVIANARAPAAPSSAVVRTAAMMR